MKRFVFKLAIVGVIFVAFTLLMDKVVMPYYVNSVKTVKMPNLIGMNISKASSVIDSLKLKIHKIMRRPSSVYPEGYIISQSPRPGVLVKEGRRVYLTVSSGEEKVLVPSLKGKSLREAKILLETKGLKLGQVNYDFSTEFPENSIFSQSIPESSLVSKGTSISVTVSLGSPEGKVKVPSVVGLPLSRVEKVLSAVDLKLGRVIYEPSDKILPNTVLEQFPRAGMYVRRGSSVDVYVAKELIIEEENENEQ